MAFTTDQKLIKKKKRCAKQSELTILKIRRPCMALTAGSTNVINNPIIGSPNSPRTDSELMLNDAQSLQACL